MDITQLKVLNAGDEVITDQPHLIAMIHSIVFQPKTITGDMRRDLENIVSLLVDSLDTHHSSYETDWDEHE